MLTRSGLGALIVAVLCAVGGIAWRYEELVVVAAGVAVLVVFAVIIARLAPRATVERRITTVRVPRGDPVQVTYRLRNDTSYRSGRAQLLDRCDDTEVRSAIDPVAGGDLVSVDGLLPTRRRGVFDLGPLDIEKVDPFFLALGRWRQDHDAAVLSTVTVHPKVYDLAGPQGQARVVENESIVRRAANDPMSGFVSMREYVAGDDPRLIHWPTTARTGTLMVREHVEVRRPEFTIVVDTAEGAATPEDFEELVDVGATLAVHALRTGLDVVVRTTDRNHPGSPQALRSEADVLDLLTPTSQSDDALQLASLFTQGFDHTSILIITGANGPSSRITGDERSGVVRIGQLARTANGIMLAAADAGDFVRRWRSVT